MMNTKQRMALASVALVVAAAPVPARATTPDSFGTWEGSGTAVDLSGKDLGAFTVTMTRKSAGPGRIRADGRVLLADGKEFVLWQDIEERGAAGYRIVSEHGSGGGQCFANGMCQSYETRADGHAFATTIAKEEGGLRILITELDGGKAIRFIQQTLRRRPAR